MTKFTIILEDGSIFKDVCVKMGRTYANTNSDIYWYLRENNELELVKNSKSIFINKNNIYYFTLSKNYN